MRINHIWEKLKDWWNNIIRCPMCSSTDTQYIDSEFYGYMLGAGILKIYECNKCKFRFGK